jgi:hypothetical protein
MDKRIAADIGARGITRICHFTASRNLPHILEDRAGIFCTSKLQNDEKAVFNITDEYRHDGNLDFVCCTIEYPNAWYLRKAADAEKLFKDWVLLFIKPHYLFQESTEFCPHNAARGGGSNLKAGFEAYNSLFDHEVRGYQTYVRDSHQLACSPTDDQAEIHVFERIRLADIVGVGVRTIAQAKNEFARLKLAGHDPTVLKFLVVPELFDAYSLSRYIRLGRRPSETSWLP